MPCKGVNSGSDKADTIRVPLEGVVVDCPNCGANNFDDAEFCSLCMHGFIDRRLAPVDAKAIAQEQAMERLRAKRGLSRQVVDEHGEPVPPGPDYFTPQRMRALREEGAFDVGPSDGLLRTLSPPYRLGTRAAAAVLALVLFVPLHLAISSKVLTVSPTGTAQPQEPERATGVYPGQEVRAGGRKGYPEEMLGYIAKAHDAPAQARLREGVTIMLEREAAGEIEAYSGGPGWVGADAALMNRMRDGEAVRFTDRLPASSDGHTVCIERTTTDSFCLSVRSKSGRVFVASYGGASDGVGTDSVAYTVRAR